VDLSVFPVFIAASVVLNWTPGPDFVFILASAAKGGLRGGLLAALGTSAGILVWVILTAAGLAALVATYPSALDIIRLLGGLYLLSLAALTLRPILDPQPLGEGTTSGSAFSNALITNCLNPKIGIFFLAVLPGFASGPAPLWQQILLLGLLFSLISLVNLALIAAAGGAARSILDRSLLARRVLIGLSGLAFAGLAFWLLLS
jgi:threonine/homoserine/homoserine lactone efflux protein